MEEQTNIHNNQVIDPHTLTVNEIKNITNTDVISGLTSSQVIDNQKKYGLNKFKEKKKANLLVRFFAQFKDVMILILLFAALISFIPIINDLINGIRISPAE